MELYQPIAFSIAAADTLDFTEKSFEDDEMKTKEGIHLPGNHHKTYSDLHADKDREVVWFEEGTL